MNDNKVVVHNYKEFLDELEKGNRKVAATEEFFEWLKAEIGATVMKKDVKHGPIGVFHGVEVTKVED